MRAISIFSILSLAIVFACGSPDTCEEKIIHVTATAYNSLAYQTNSNPSITAFGDSLKPGLRYIAVSRDLIDSGMVYNTEVKIKGFDSLFLVKDKMNRRYRKHIDIYMGNDVQKAKKWGKKKLNVEFCIKSKDSVLN